MPENLRRVFERVRISPKCICQKISEIGLRGLEGLYQNGISVQYIRTYASTQNFPSLSSRTRKSESLVFRLVSDSDSVSMFQGYPVSDSESDSKLSYL